jgi:predicted enzyme related to lactoylglutathione lyase
MINGMHALIYTKDPEGTRKFFGDVLGLASVDVGQGWLIYGLPPSEVAAHPAEAADDNGTHEFYLMCDDIHRTMEELGKKGIEFVRPAADQGWGIVTAIRMPGGGQLGLYEPKHARPPQG